MDHVTAIIHALVARAGGHVAITTDELRAAMVDTRPLDFIGKKDSVDIWLQVEIRGMKK